MKSNNIVQKSIAGILLLVAVAMLTVGAMRTHTVYDDDEVAAEFGIFTPQTISEAEMVIDTTFTGVTYRDGRLFSTYDRTEKGGKRACPT
jgi:hypothetical protein